MSTRSNPFEELERLLEAMSRQFDDASRVWEAEGPLGRWASGAESMAIDLVDRDGEFVVTVDLPGFERDDVDIRVTDHTLRIEAEHEAVRDEEGERFIRHERRHESTDRSVRLPGEVDKQGVAARMRNGVLTITLPKTEVEEARKIEIDGE
jgi:HSP20 family protein